jgi:hypothetical protein
MKGIIFNLLEEVVTQKYGANTWDQLLETAKVDGAFTSLGSYPDEQLVALVDAAAKALNLPANQIIRWFGGQAIPLLVKKYPVFFAKHTSTRPFLLTLNAIIHPEVRKLYPGAHTPDFELDASSPDVLVMGYRSQRKLCALAEGLIEGASNHYRETVTINHPVCMHRGDDCCRLEMSFVPSIDRTHA